MEIKVYLCFYSGPSNIVVQGAYLADHMFWLCYVWEDKKWWLI